MNKFIVEHHVANEFFKGIAQEICNRLSNAEISSFNEILPGCGFQYNKVGYTSIGVKTDNCWLMLVQLKGTECFKCMRVTGDRYGMIHDYTHESIIPLSDPQLFEKIIAYIIEIDAIHAKPPFTSSVVRDPSCYFLIFILAMISLTALPYYLAFAITTIVVFTLRIIWERQRQ